MIVQRLLDGSPRFVTQRDHALLAGALARAWDVELSEVVYRAIDAHDDPWAQIDRAPVPDGHGWFHDFVTLPQADRLELYTSGLDAMGDGFAALLTSLHFERLLGRHAPDRWRAIEAARQARIAASLELDEGRLEADLDWLRFFDAASLYACMTAPDLDGQGRPAWLAPGVWTRDPLGRAFVPVWRGPGELHLRGAPTQNVTHALPCLHRAPMLMRIVATEPKTELPDADAD